MTDDDSRRESSRSSWPRQPTLRKQHTRCGTVIAPSLVAILAGCGGKADQTTVTTTATATVTVTPTPGISVQQVAGTVASLRADPPPEIAALLVATRNSASPVGKVSYSQCQKVPKSDGCTMVETSKAGQATENF